MATKTRPPWRIRALYIQSSAKVGAAVIVDLSVQSLSIAGLALLCGMVAMVYAHIPDANQVAVVNGNNNFGIKMYQMLSTTPGNIFISPFSAASVLAMLSTGAGGQTFTEIVQGLDLPCDKNVIEKGFKSLTESIQKAADSNITLDTANRIYCDSGFHIKSKYLKDAEVNFHSDIVNTNFSGDPEGSRTSINNWVEGKTNNKIQGLLPQGSVTPSTRTVMVNVLYFKGNWSSQFSPMQTTDESFKISCNTNTSVKMMHKTDHFRYAKFPDFQAIQLDYQGGQISMLILLPKTCDGLNKLEANLTSLNLTHINESMTLQRVRLSLPKFEIEQTNEMNSILQELGMKQMFTNQANFSGIAAGIKVSTVVQKTFLKVSEDGTEAAAATGIVVGVTSVVTSEPPIPEFKADHTFIFNILHKSSSTVLFIGRYAGSI